MVWMQVFVQDYNRKKYPQKLCNKKQNEPYNIKKHLALSFILLAHIMIKPVVFENVNAGLAYPIGTYPGVPTSRGAQKQEKGKNKGGRERQREQKKEVVQNITLPLPYNQKGSLQGPHENMFMVDGGPRKSCPGAPHTLKTVLCKSMLIEKIQENKTQITCQSSPTQTGM